MVPTTRSQEGFFLRPVCAGRLHHVFRNPQGGDALRPEPVGIPEGWELGAWIHRSDFILSLKEPEFCASSSITCKIRTRGSLHSGHRGRYGVDR